MKLKCRRVQLFDALTNVSKAVPSKSNIPALEGIKLSLSENSLELTGYDLELGIRTRIEAETSDNGEFVVNSRLFSEIIRRMSSDEVSIEVDEKLNVSISGKSATYDISAISAAEYPDFPDIPSTESIDIPQYILKNMIDHTNHAVATNENKPILTGELFDIEDGLFRMIAIDGFRLAVRSEKIICSNNYNFVVPGKTLNEISKLLSKNETEKEDNEKENNPVKEELCRIFVEPKKIIFQISDYCVVSRLLEGEFHNYKTSIPTDFNNEIILKTKDFIDSVERCSLLISEKNKCPIRCVFEEGILKIDCKTTVGKINDSIEADVIGDRIEIGFNHKYLADALKACDTDKIRIQLLANNKPVKILPVAGDSFLYLLMPIQLKTSY